MDYFTACFFPYAPISKSFLAVLLVVALPVYSRGHVCDLLSISKVCYVLYVTYSSKSTRRLCYTERESIEDEGTVCGQALSIHHLSLQACFPRIVVTDFALAVDKTDHCSISAMDFFIATSSR